MASQLLERRIYNRALKMHKVKKFPSFVSGAEYKSLNQVAASGEIFFSDFVKPLEQELKKFGTIGKKFKGSSIGFCAETIAANRVLKIIPTKLEKISIGQAIRPRTLQKGKKCIICKKLF